MNCDFVVIGAGPVGLSAAKTAADAGFDVVVLEETVQRELFDRELFRIAMMAGVKLFLNIKIKEFIIEGGHIVGVKTASLSLPEIRAKVTIVSEKGKSNDN